METVTGEGVTSIERDTTHPVKVTPAETNILAPARVTPVQARIKVTPSPADTVQVEGGHIQVQERMMSVIRTSLSRKVHAFWARIHQQLGRDDGETMKLHIERL